MKKLTFEEIILCTLGLIVSIIGIYMIASLIDSLFHTTTYVNGVVIEKKIDSYQPPPILVQTGNVMTMLPQPYTTDHVLKVKSENGDNYKVVVTENIYKEIALKTKVKVKINNTLVMRNSYYYYDGKLND